MADANQFHAYGSREDASIAAADAVLVQIMAEILKTGRAGVLLSGGSSPRDALKRLSSASFDDWDAVRVGLVDERWVETCSIDSNERLVRECFLQGNASAAKLISMRGDAETIDAAAREASVAYAEDLLAPTVVMLGMGADGHTASWFPGSRSLAEAARGNADPGVIALDVAGCPVAGDYPERLSVNLAVIQQARHAVLLMFGAEKRDVFEAALTAPAEQHPVRYAIEALGNRLSVYWAE